MQRAQISANNHELARPWGLRFSQTLTDNERKLPDKLWAISGAKWAIQLSAQRNSIVTTILEVDMRREGSAKMGGWLCIKANECEYKERERCRLKEHFINRINDEEIVNEIRKELTTKED